MAYNCSLIIFLMFILPGHRKKAHVRGSVLVSCCHGHAGQCVPLVSVYRARNYFYSLIGSFSLTRHRTCFLIGWPIRYWRVVVISNLRLAQRPAGLRSAAWCL